MKPLLVIILAAKTEIISDLCISCKSVRMIVLRERTHLNGSL